MFLITEVLLETFLIARWNIKTAPSGLALVAFNGSFPPLRSVLEQRRQRHIAGSADWWVQVGPKRNHFYIFQLKFQIHVIKLDFASTSKR